MKLEQTYQKHWEPREIAAALAEMYASSLATGTVLARVASVVLLCKKGCKIKPRNKRPVSWNRKVTTGF